MVFINAKRIMYYDNSATTEIYDTRFSPKYYHIRIIPVRERAVRVTFYTAQLLRPYAYVFCPLRTTI